MRGMTQYLLDIASYQRGIDLVKVRAAGFSIANVKTSQGVGYTFADAGSYARQAHALGMGVATFHWLDGSASGAAQADAWWKVAGPIGRDVGPMALQVDCEDTTDPATWAILRDFVHAAADRLGHLPFIYTGDWWAQSGGRAGWDVHSLSPWFMAAPNAGYPGSYPGDTSAHWRAGYWGYANLSLMQYAVEPIAGAGGGNISKTAIRDPAVWPALTGGSALMSRDYGGYPIPKEVGDRPDSVLLADTWGGEILGHSPFVPTAKSYRTALLDRVDTAVAGLNAKADADAVRDKAVQVALDGVVAAVTAGGGSVEAAPIVAAVQAVAADAKARFDQLHGDNVALQQALDASQSRVGHLLTVLAGLGVDLAKIDDDQAATG